jgi:hypothetical protein
MEIVDASCPHPTSATFAPRSSETSTPVGREVKFARVRGADLLAGPA